MAARALVSIAAMVTFGSQAMLTGAALHAASTSRAADVLPRPAPPFEGKIGTSSEDSTPDWPAPVTAPKGAPNVVVILLDDAGFAASSTFGGLVETPELDRLASQGLRYNRFHTTAMCSPTRAALLSGRNDHKVGFGDIADFARGFPGYTGIWPKSAASIAEVLRQNGYSTAAFGKWHNTPPWEITPVGPFDRWPTGLGFEHFYGFIGAGDSQWEPMTLYRDTQHISPPSTAEQGYFLTTDVANEAIGWIRAHESLAPDKPYFLYFATGATHMPHQAPEDWIAKYKGKFDKGWDTLHGEIFARQKASGVIPPDTEATLRPKDIPAWDTLTDVQKKVFARQMEVFAGFLAQTDHEVGRLISTIENGKDADNTLIIYIAGDNGASAEGGVEGGLDHHVTAASQLPYLDEMGGPLRFGHFAAGWAWMTSAPFKWFKRYASHLGGLRAPMVVTWPDKIKDQGGLRTQFTAVNDVAPTIYEAAGIAFPSEVNGVKQMPLDGTSFLYSFEDGSAASRHRLQVFEQRGNRSIYKDGWFAGALHTPLPWVYSKDTNYADDQWELYNIDTDYSQANDLADQYPDKLKELRSLFHEEAQKNDIYPFSEGGNWNQRKHFGTYCRKNFTYYDGLSAFSSQAGPDFSRPHDVAAHVTVPSGDIDGILISDGMPMYGFSLYIKDRRLVYEAMFGGYHRVITSDMAIPAGDAQLGYTFSPSQKDGESGTIRLYINEKLAGQGELTIPSPIVWGLFTIGKSDFSLESRAYTPPSAFTDTLKRISIDTEPPSECQKPRVE